MWEKLEPKRSDHLGIITILSDGQISFTKSFLENESLQQYEFVEVLLDRDLRRIGFKFSKEETPTRINKIGGHTKVSSRMLSYVDWIKPLLSLPANQRRFVVETDETVLDAEKGVRYYLSIGYQVTEKRLFYPPYDCPNSGGVYRLYSGSEIIKIGESNDLVSRLKEHAKSNGIGRVDSFDFILIEDEDARKKHEKFLLKAFREITGRLPRYNLITA